MDTMDSDGKSSDCALAIKFSLQKFLGENNISGILSGQVTRQWWRWYNFFDVQGNGEAVIDSSSTRVHRWHLLVAQFADHAVEWNNDDTW